VTVGFAEHAGRPAATLRKRARHRGVTLVEAILYLAIASSVLVFSAGVLEGERSRQQDAVSAADLRQVITSAQMFVAVKYDDIRRDLVADTASGAPVVAEIPMSEIVDAGFLPSIFVGGGAGMRQIHGQEYALLARAVLRNSPDVPQTTVIKDTSTIVDPGPTPGTFVIKPELIDRQAFPAVGSVPANDELDLEVVLVTRGGPAPGVRVQTGNRIVDLTQLPSAGFMTLETAPPASAARVLANGPYGGWTLDMTPYTATGLVEPGRFASLVALSRYGVLSTVPEDNSAAEGVARCADVPAGSADHAECSVRNEVYSSVVFNSWDSNADGTDDSFPAIENVFGISFAGPVDRDRDGTTDAQIANLLTISCLAGGSVSAVSNTLSVDCPTTSVQDLAASGVAASVVNVSSEMKVYGRPLTASQPLSGSPAFEVSTDGVVKVSQRLDVDGTLNLDGSDIAPKLAATSSMWEVCPSHSAGCFKMNEAAQVSLDMCPIGSQRVVTAAPAAFPMSKDVVKIEVLVENNGTHADKSLWNVSLRRTLTESGSTTTDINPDGTQLLIQSRCE
jgi:hypothetical protein